MFCLEEQLLERSQLNILRPKKARSLVKRLIKMLGVVYTPVYRRREPLNTKIIDVVAERIEGNGS